MIITLIILAVIGAGGSFTFAQHGFGPGMMGMGPGMMDSVDSEYEFLIKMIPHHEEAVANAKYLKENTNREELDHAFLEDMIFHHMGAVMMSQQLIIQGLDEHREVYLLARSIRDSQR